MQCLSILVTGPKGPRSFCFVVSYETFYPNSAYTLPGLQMGTDKLLRSPDEMQGMGNSGYLTRERSRRQDERGLIS